jgi:hypothetical protein
MRRQLVTRHTTPAPDFTTEPYPSAGDRIGPAWQRVWDELHDLAEADGAYLGAIAAARVDLGSSMVNRLLREAVAAGWLRVDGDGRARRNRVYSLTHAARLAEELRQTHRSVSTIV